MRYFLTGIDVAKGMLDDDVSDTRPYYELGWEAVTTHFDAKRFKEDGKIDSAKDIIVTCAGREFLYRAEFDRVISFSEFSRVRSPGDHVVSLMERYANGRIPLDYFDDEPDPRLRRYRYFHRDAEIIRNIERVGTESLHQGRPYACVQVRLRGHGDYRNTPMEMLDRVLEKLVSRYHRVFLVGRDIPERITSSQVIVVDLGTYVSLIEKDLCHVIFGSFTGPMQLAAIYSKARMCLVLNFDDYDIDELNSPIMLGRCFRYSASQFLCVPPDAVEHLLAHYQL